MRDNQRQAFYQAQWTFRKLLDRSFDFPTVQLFGSTFDLTEDRKFATLESVQAYVDQVLALDWVRSEWGSLAEQKVTVRSRKTASAAHYQNNTIAIAEINNGGAWSLRETVVLHELAHHFSKYEPEGHGPLFASAFVRLIENITTFENAAVLRMLMYENGVKIA
jgi:putative metallohydrolase (TIGR04338 family)